MVANIPVMWHEVVQKDRIGKHGQIVVKKTAKKLLQCVGLGLGLYFQSLEKMG